MDMTPAVHLNGSTPYHPRLPTELWGLIIQESMYVPGGLEPDSMSLYFGVPATSLEKPRLRQWRAALSAGSKFLRVNHTWHSLTAPVLYEYVVLGRGHVLSPLAGGMEKSYREQTTDGHRHHLGWWTKRLDVNIRDGVNPRAHWNSLVRIIRLLPNLRILTFSITAHGHENLISLPPNILGALVCYDTLRIVHWYTYHLPSLNSWTTFLTRFRHLHSANGANAFLSDAKDSIHLESLELIHFDGSHSELAIRPKTGIWALSLPAVRCAAYDLDPSAHHRFAARSFFSAIGPRLHAIQLHQENAIKPAEHVFMLKQTSYLMKEHCHNLQQINLSFRSWSLFCAYIPDLPKTVSKIVVRILKGQLARRRMASLFGKTLHEYKTRNSQLKAVQFYSSSTIRHLQVHSRVLQEGLANLQTMGLQILDDTGAPL